MDFSLQAHKCVYMTFADVVRMKLETLILHTTADFINFDNQCWFWCRVTFQPAVNRRQVDGLDMDGDYNQEGNVFNRLLQYASKLTEKKQLREQLCHRPIDPNTGRKFFRPRTGRKPQNDVSNSSHPGGKQDVCPVAEMKIYLVSNSICGTILSRVMWKEKTE